MRLPQSSSPAFSICVASIILITLATAPFAPAASAQVQLQCSPSSLRFGVVALGQSETQLVVLSNSGTTSVTVSAIASNDTAFTVSGATLPLTLAAGQSANLNLIFTPAQKGWMGGTVTFTSNASNPTLRLPIAGTGVTSDALTVAPETVSFGQVAVGKTTSQSVVVTNASAWKQTITAIQATGAGFSVSGLSVPAVLNPGQVATLTVAFSPSGAGESGGSIFLTGPAVNIPLTGIGTITTVGALSMSPATLNFGSVDVGTSASQSFSLTASGGSVTISSDSSSSSQYSLAGLSLPLTLSSGQSVTLSATYTPTTGGTTTGTLTFASNASNGQTSESLTGSGVPPSVSLSWSASTSSVIGYNVYRGTAAGTYSKVNSAVNATTSYTDNTVSAGITYYYVATAVNSNGQESAYSSPPLQVSVP